MLSKKCLLILSFSLFGCQTAKPYKPKVWYSNPTNAAIEYDKKAIKCESTKFQDYVCIHQNTMASLYNKCTQKAWFKFW